MTTERLLLEFNSACFAGIALFAMKPAVTECKGSCYPTLFGLIAASQGDFHASRFCRQLKSPARQESSRAQRLHGATTCHGAA